MKSTMVTFIRFCLCIILGAAALAVLGGLFLFGAGMWDAYRTSTFMAQSTCADYLATARGTNEARKATYNYYLRNSGDSNVKMFDPALGGSDTTFRNIVKYCLKNPQSSLREAVIGHTPADIYKAVNDTINAEAASLAAPRAPDYTTPLPSAPMPVSATVQ